MRTLRLIFAGLILLTVPANGEVLKNSDVVKLLKAGLSGRVVIEKINTSESEFQTDTDSLLLLKELKVPDSVIQAMIESAAVTKTKTTASPAPLTAPPSSASSEVPWYQPLLASPPVGWLQAYDVFSGRPGIYSTGILTVTSHDISYIAPRALWTRERHFQYSWKDLASFCVERGPAQNLFYFTANGGRTVAVGLVKASKQGDELRELLLKNTKLRELDKCRSADFPW